LSNGHATENSAPSNDQLPDRDQHGARLDSKESAKLKAQKASLNEFSSTCKTRLDLEIQCGDLSKLITRVQDVADEVTRRILSSPDASF
jgi:hypothetical protein